MEDKIVEYKPKKIDQLIINILLYNTILRIMGFPEEYNIPQFDNKLWAIVVANITAIIIFGGHLLWEKRKEKKQNV